MKNQLAAKTKSAVGRAMAVLFLLLLAQQAKPQANPKALEALVYRYNNALQYDSSRLVINNFLQHQNITNADRFYANLQMSYTHKRLQDYDQVHKCLDIAIGYGLQAGQKDFFSANYNCQKSFAYFDVSEYVKADSLMLPLITSNYRYLEADDKGKVMIQKAFMLLRNNQYPAAAKMYNTVETFMQQHSPCDLPMVYASEIQLYAAMNQFDKMDECYKKGVACADSCGILKYRMLCTQNMYYYLRKAGNYERAIYFAQAWDSMNLIFKTNDNLQKLKDIDYQLKEQLKEVTINKQKGILLKNKLFINRLATIFLLLICSIIGVVSYRENKQAEIKRNLHRIFSKQLYEKIEEERKRIASDLHDGVCHELLTLKNNYSLTAASNKTYIGNILEHLRNISRNLHPVMFEHLGLKTTIEQMVEKIADLNLFMISTNIQYNGTLDKSTEIQLYRIVQEACNNMIKHANAVAGRISIAEDNEMVTIIIEDNGKGFIVDKKLQSSASFGLHNMVERANSVGGNSLISSSDKGTTITISIPKKQ
jgi:signal transduction histidine kinase